METPESGHPHAPWSGTITEVPFTGVGPWHGVLLRILGFYLRHVGEHPGRWRLATRAVALAPVLRETLDRRVIRVRGAGRFLVDGTSQTSRMLFATGGYERGSTRILEQHLSQGATMIDVGANIGYFAVVAARLVGPSGRVVAFEPQPRVREQLTANVRLNALHNVAIRSEALSAVSGQVVLHTGPATDTGLASLRPLAGSGSVSVSQARFDDLWDGRPVSVVKIDVEGAEMRVLTGMRACLSRDRPHLIVEVTDQYLRAFGDSSQSLYEWLRELGYSMSRIDEDGTLVPIDSIESLLRAPSQFNAFCVAGRRDAGAPLGQPVAPS